MLNKGYSILTKLYWHEWILRIEFPFIYHVYGMDSSFWVLTQLMPADSTWKNKLIVQVHVVVPNIMTNQSSK